MEDPELVKPMGRVLDRAGRAVEREYKQQVPVDRGDLRSNVQMKKEGNLERVITTRAISSSGGDYAIWVHEGTKERKGSADGGRKSGRVRSSGFYGFGSRLEMAKVFANLNKKGKLKGVTPNKFADRTKKNTEPQVLQILNDGVDKIIHK